jgi:hypothetical protein
MRQTPATKGQAKYSKGRVRVWKISLMKGTYIMSSTTTTSATAP